MQCLLSSLISVVHTTTPTTPTITVTNMLGIIGGGCWGEWLKGVILSASHGAWAQVGQRGVWG